MVINKFGQNPLISSNRQRQKEVDGSPIFQDTNPALTDGSDWTRNYDGLNNTEKRFLPFDQTVIVNNQSSDIQFFINQDGDPIFIPGNNTTTLNRPIRSWKIRNVSGSTISAFSNGTGIIVDVSTTRLDADKAVYLERSATPNPLSFMAKLLGRMI